MSANATQQLDHLQNSLRKLQSGGLSAHGFSETARAQSDLLDALPPRYREVLEGLLDRLESSALFSEESCSFSQKDLIDSLQMWHDKAALQLQRD